MIDERIAYYIQGIFALNMVLYFGFLKKPESNFFLFHTEYETSDLYKKGFRIATIFLLVLLFVVFSEAIQMPAIVNVSHEMVSGEIKTYERR